MIMSKHRNSDKSTADGKKESRSVILKEKLGVIRMYKCNAFMIDIASGSEWL
jgi:hypothetical protein